MRHGGQSGKDACKKEWNVASVGHVLLKIEGATRVQPSFITARSAASQCSTAAGSGVATGPQFDEAHLPEIIFQDDPTETEVTLGAGTGRLLADFTLSSDQTNRTLIKFLEEGTPWYVPLYIQAENLLGSAAVADPLGRLARNIRAYTDPSQ